MRIFSHVTLLLLAAVASSAPCAEEGQAVNHGLEFRQTLFIGCSSDVLWTHLVDRRLVDQYYLCQLEALEPVVGGVVSYGFKGQSYISGVIRAFNAGKELTHTFRFLDSSDPETTVSYLLEPIGDKLTRLTLIHSGFEKPEGTYADVFGGWPVILSKLKTLVETGKPLEWPAPEPGK